MEKDQDLHVDDAYIQSFNDGYILAKELGMTTDSLEGINAGNQRMQAMQKGIEQYEEEIEIDRHKEKLREEKEVEAKSPPVPEIDKDRDIDL